MDIFSYHIILCKVLILCFTMKFFFLCRSVVTLAVFVTAFVAIFALYTIIIAEKFMVGTDFKCQCNMQSWGRRLKRERGGYSMGWGGEVNLWVWEGGYSMDQGVCLSFLGDDIEWSFNRFHSEYRKVVHFCIFYIYNIFSKKYLHLSLPKLDSFHINVLC